MPTIFELFGLRFFFYSDEHLPIHLHVAKGDGEAKIQVEPDVEVIYNRGLKKQELKQAVQLVKMFKTNIIMTWNQYFD